ncbi:hypothetical protein [Sphingomonas sp. BK235]|uniref:hypothetical protein n=1 Tax=Sphingomonas sp. BK235 TaxID=2512131 RepID=UPI0010526E3F|nr:hypothetical protein [Sphingomonas sp. BK235]TCP35921.1 hypothetical protein EV292_102511 [Sphingomonas sp. BK235]
MRWLMMLVAVALAAPALADTWMSPTRAVYTSPKKTSRLIVEPRALESQLAYFEDKSAGKEPAGQRAGETKRTARGVLERRVGGRWITQWEVPLANEVAPVDALVSDDGQHVVTFDNWHSMGLGENVVVIYGAGGQQVRSLRLDDLLPPDYLEALPRSVSSLHWRREARLARDGRHVAIPVVVPEEESRSDARPRTVDVSVDLATGAVVPPSGAAWDRALTAATRVARDRRAWQAAQRAAFAAPLSPPAQPGEPAWHGYLRELFYRVDPAWREGFPKTTVLRSPGAKDYAPSVTWVREALREAEEGDAVMLAAPAAPERLVAIVEEEARTLPAGKLRGVRVYPAVPPAAFAAIRSALATSGAEVVAVDLAAPVPQRPERLAERTAASFGGAPPPSHDGAAEQAAVADALADSMEALAAEVAKESAATPR